MNYLPAALRVCIRQVVRCASAPRVALTACRKDSPAAGSYPGPQLPAGTLFLNRQVVSSAALRSFEAYCREQGHSLRAIAGAVGVTQTQVARDLAGVTEVTPEQSRGLDGKSYPARKAPPVPPVVRALAPPLLRACQAAAS